MAPFLVHPQTPPSGNPNTKSTLLLVLPAGTVVNLTPDVKKVLLLNVMLVITTPATEFMLALHEVMLVFWVSKTTVHLTVDPS
jgi:hypothetical protein